MVGMTDNNQHIVRGATGNGNSGSFAPHPNRAPEPDQELNARAELDAANKAYQDTGEAILIEVEQYLTRGMPATAHRVEFEPSDQGDYLTVSRAWDADGLEVATEDDYETWADVDDVISFLGDPDDNRTVFRDLLTEGEFGRWEWKRTEETDEDDATATFLRIQQLAAVRRDQGNDSQAGAIIAVKRMLPEGANIVLTWGDQPGPDYLDIEEIVLADGTVITDWDDAEEHDIDWDEVGMAATDIRDTSDPKVVAVEGRRDHYTLNFDA